MRPLRATPTRARLIRAGLTLAGLAALGAALGADLVGVGAAGFGARQALLACAGVALLIAAPRLARPGLAGTLVRRWAATPSLQPRSALWLGAALGLLTGTVEAVQQACRHYGFGVVLHQPPDLVWMAPLSHLVLFTTTAMLLAGLAQLLPRLLRLPAALFALLLLAGWSQTMPYPWLDAVARLAIAAGIALQATRLAMARAAGLPALCRRAAGLLLALVGLASAAVLLAGPSPAPRPAPPTGGDRYPNLLLIVLDTVRADHLPWHGYPRATAPAMAALASDSVVFERAISTSPWTLPSHASLFTGRYPHQLSADWLTPLDGRDRTLAEVLRDAGYATAGFAGNLVYCLREQGLARGFDCWVDFHREPVVVATSTELGRWLLQQATGRDDWPRNDAATVAGDFLRWLPNRGSRPFFAFLNLFDAHAFYDPPPSMQALFGPRAPHLLDWGIGPWSAEEMQGFVDAYDACIAAIDRQVARVLARLRQLDLLDDTLVVITADHGEQFGEHGLMDHANSLYDVLLHVPLVLHFPQRGLPVQRVETPITLRDVPATLLDLLGLPPALPGCSLRHHWQPDGGTPASSPLLSSVSRGIHRTDRVPIARGDMSSLFDPPWHLIQNGDGALELYDLGRDSYEQHDLTETAPGGRRAADLRERLRGLLGR